MLLAWCACGITTAAAQSQPSPRDQRFARLYFLRQSGVLGDLGARGKVMINEQVVGILAAGTYFHVDRPAGRYKLRVQPTVQVLLPNFFETEMTLAAGQIYYFEVGAATSPTGAGFMNAIMAGNAGKRMNGRSFNNSYQFNSLDNAAGAAEISKLKPMKP